MFLNRTADLFTKVKNKNKMVMDAINQIPHKGIPVTAVNIMQHEYIEKIAGVLPGDYVKNPNEVYMKCQRNLGACVLDQYLAQNPLTMSNIGYKQKEKTATTGLKEVYLEGVNIDSPEAVVEHLEKIAIPFYRANIVNYNEEKKIEEILKREYEIQRNIGDSILKTGYSYFKFPTMSYSSYGYENYFMAYALYPEIVEKYFSIQADYCVLNNTAAIKATERGNLTKLVRLDHDMADSRGTLVSIKSLDKLWFPHFNRCIEPAIKQGIKFIWHCDGNLMEMVPRLLEVGLKGFQGFQYEDGMDYLKICGMRTREKEPLIIWAGVSVTTTLPHGTSSDIKKEMKFLVDNGPGAGLFLRSSSSITPGVPWKNIKTFIEGLQYYKEYGGKQ